MTTLVWFTDDLRLHDNQALYLASMRAEPLICLYCVDEDWFKPNHYGLKRMGDARWRFLYESLQALDASLKEYGQRLCVLQGSSVDIVSNITNIPFENRSFDLIACYEILEHLPCEKFYKTI